MKNPSFVSSDTQQEGDMFKDQSRGRWLFSAYYHMTSLPAFLFHVGNVMSENLYTANVKSSCLRK